MYKPIWPGSYYFKSFTFTTMGTSGSKGPADDQTYSDAPWPSPNYFSIKYGQQNWTVPANGLYQITAAGAYGATPGRVVTGQAILSQDQVVTMLVGQQPTPLTANVADNVTVGGGGGTFVVTNGAPLIVASGGGNVSGAFLPSGNGLGNNGAGYFGDGSNTNPFFQFLVPRAYLNGGFGNVYEYGQPGLPEEGGFGGGQSPVNKVTNITSITASSGVVTCTTQVPHGYPYTYIVTIAGTTTYDGVQTITATGQSAFTFSNLNTPPSPASGTVFGLTTYSGAGGYTGGGVAGATCYADPSVQNFTDLGATSNTSGYVTVTLVNPVPLVQSPTWNKTWTTTLDTFVPPNSGGSAVAFGNGVYVAVTKGTVPVLYSYDGINWNRDAVGAVAALWTSVSYGNGLFAAVSSDGYRMVSSDGVHWKYNNGSSVPADIWGSVTYGNGLFLAISFNSSMWSSGPEEVWTLNNSVYGRGECVTYSNGRFVAVSSRYPYVQWTADPKGSGWVANYSAPASSWSSVTYGNGRFVAVSQSYPFVMCATDPTGTWTANYSVTDVSGGLYSVTYGNGWFVAVSLTASIWTTDPTDKWTVNYSITISSWFTVTYGNERFVAVSPAYPYVMWVTNPSGAWTDNSMLEGNWISVTYGNGRFVAVSLSSYPYVMCATDPTGTWTANYSVPANNWRSVTYGNGRFVAVSQTSAPYVMWATDPTGAWTLNIPLQYSSVTYGNGRFVTVAKNGLPASQYSTDGTIWKNGDLTIDKWSTVSYGNGAFSVLTNMGSIVSAYSTDGITWSYRAPLISSFTVPSPGIFLPYSVSTSTDGSKILISSLNYSPNVFTSGVLTKSFTAVRPNEGYGWSAAMSADGQKIVIGAPNASSNVGNVYMYTNGTLTRTLTGASANVMFGSSLALSADGLVLIVGAQGTYVGGTPSSSPYANVYTNGVLTQTFTGGAGFGWACAINATGTVFAVSSLLIGFGIGGEQKVYYTRVGVTTPFTGNSRDGFGWAIGLNTDGSVLAVSAYLAAYVNVYKDGGFSYKLQGNYADQFGWSLAVSSDGKKLAVGAPNGDGFIKLYRDGNFEKIALGSGNKGTGWTVAFYTDYILSVSRYGSNVDVFSLLTYPDSWTGSTYGSNGVFAAVAASGSTMYSQTGLAWSQGGSLGVSSNCITYGQGYFVAPSNNPSNANVAISADCLVWSNVTLASGGAFSGATYGGNQYGFVIVSPTNFEIGFTLTFFANPNNIAKSAKLNYTTWSQATYGNGVFVAGGPGLLQSTFDGGQTWSSNVVSNTIVSVSYSRHTGTFLAFGDQFVDGTYTSHDGLYWQKNNNLISLNVPSKNARTVWGLDKFVAVLEGDSNVFYSSDGVYWKITNVGTRLDSWKSVAYGNGRFVACPTASNAMVSSNGITWIGQNLVSTSVASSIAYGNGIFVTVSSSGATYSYNGLTWTSTSAPADTWSSVVYGNGYFIAISKNGTKPVMYSQDGIQWYTDVSGAQAIDWKSIAYGDNTFLAIEAQGSSIMTTKFGEAF